MTRSEDDLRAALRQLEQRADRQGAPPADVLIAAVGADRGHHGAGARPAHVRRWLAPLATAALVAGAALAAATLTGGQHGSAQPDGAPVGAPNASTVHTRHTAHTPSTHPSHVPSTSETASRAAPTPDRASRIAAGILDDAAAKLAAQPWTAPDPDQFFYVHTTEATTWTSVSGTRAGYGRTSDGGRIWIDGCDHGRFAPGSDSRGSCSMSQVWYYLADAPTTPSAWDAYLEGMAPGARAANAQGKIIVQVLHQELVSPKAAAALLRYTESCPGLHTLHVAAVRGEALVGVTCTSMTNGSYGLAFDAATHAFAGFVPVDHETGKPAGAAEIVLNTGIVSKIGQVP